MIIIDSQKKEGVWTEFSDSKFLVSHYGNMKFQRALTRLQAPHRRKLDKGTLDPAISKKILCEAMADGLVLDWKDVSDSQGNKVPFSREACLQALTNNDDLRDYLTDFSTNLDNFREEEIEKEGNF